MKPYKGIEEGARAWNRWVETWKFRQHGQLDCDIPMRLRGYSEIAMRNFTDRERSAIDLALCRGYRLAHRTRWTKALDVLLLTQDYNIGYLGKTRANLWFPTRQMRDDCIKHMEAQLVMTDKFSAGAMSKFGDQRIRIYVNSWEPTKAHFSELRAVVDEYMAKWAAPREQFARSLRPDSAVVRVPFDTHHINKQE